MHAYYRPIAGGRSVGGAMVVALWATLASAGCGNLLDVENPNNIKGDDIKKPEASNPLVNGAMASVAAALPGVMLVTGTAADEFDWVGSRDSWRELDQGNVHNPFNEFTDGFFPGMARARWLADEAVKVLDSLNQAKAPIDVADLARAYLYAAVARISIADQFEDWALSDRDKAAPPVGKANMFQFYDTAVEYLDKGLAVPGISSTLKLQLTATKARAQFGKTIWEQIHTTPIPLGARQNSAAASTALAAIAMLPSPDWKFQFSYSATTIGNSAGAWVNSRQEMRIGRAYAVPSPTAPTWGATALNDPITGAPDPVIDAEQKAFKTGQLYPRFTVTSAREMRLIVAEDALARGDISTFATQINAIRLLDGLTPWDQAAPQVPALDILMHERRVNLFLQGRRLLDHYRFGPSTYPQDWLATSTAVTKPGTLLPITAIECLSNPNIGAENCGK